MHAARRALTAVTTAAAVVVVGACGSDEADGVVPLETAAAPATSPSASTDSVEQEHVDEALALVTAYYDDLNELGRGGYAEGMRMRGYWSNSEAWQGKEATYAQRHEDGWRLEGGTEIVSTEVVEYVPDPTGEGYEQVRVDVCGDVSSSRMVDGDGAELERADDVPDRYITQYLIAHQGPLDRWAIAELDAEVDRTC